jgi:hypothetical protein
MAGFPTNPPFAGRRSSQQGGAQQIRPSDAAYGAAIGTHLSLDSELVLRRISQAARQSGRAARRWSASMASRELRSSFSQWTVQSESAVSERTKSWMRRW